MTSNRNKKKQDPELLNNSKEEQPFNNVISENDNVVTAKAVKKKRKFDDINNKKPKKSIQNDQETNEVKRVRKKRKKEVPPEATNSITENNIEPPFHENEQKLLQENGEILNVNESPEKKEELHWPDEDLDQLISNMQRSIPEHDTLAYSTRAEKLDWNNVAFNNYNAEDCKKMWNQLQKRIRRFRLLNEVLEDAKKWLVSPKVNKTQKGKRHPDMPRRPPSSYILFYLRNRDKAIGENPGLEGPEIAKLMGHLFKSLTPTERGVYEKEAARCKELYLQQMQTFYEQHPELAKEQQQKQKPEKDKVDKAIKLEKSPKSKVEKSPSKVEKSPKVEKKEKPPKPEKIKPPKRCQTAFGIYFDTECSDTTGVTDKLAYKEKCKETWKNMPDKKKLPYILKADEDLLRYNRELKEYKVKNPEYQANEIKSNLTKEERAIKQRSTGKPTKPPNSAYFLYSKTMLQSEEIKVIAAKNRMNYIANKWKTADDETKRIYRERLQSLSDKYKEEYNAYLQTLPEDERKIIIEEDMKKSRKQRKPRSPNAIKPGPKPKIKSPKPEEKKRGKPGRKPSQKHKFKEPEQPPISPAKYFATLYKGDEDPIQAWRALPTEEKRRYEEELTEKKQAYIVEFEKFLKSLTKEELEAFSRSRQQQMKSDEDDEEDDEDDDEDGESDSSCSSVKSEKDDSDGDSE